MESYSLRKPVVAGQFYPDSSQELKNQIAGFLSKEIKKVPAIGCILPHAGYDYSGNVAAATVASIEIKPHIILIGPNHTGYGAAFSIMGRGIWQTPLGEVPIDSAITKLLLADSKYLEDNPMAHRYEHSLEVELPFLQYFKTDFSIVPISISSDKLAALKDLGREIAAAIVELKIKDSTLLVASSDMTHYEPEAQAQEKDQEAIKAIEKLDEDALMKKVLELNISMCGVAPVIVMLSAAKLLGAETGKLIKYQTSGDTTGDKNSVVGYAGMIIY